MSRWLSFALVAILCTFSSLALAGNVLTVGTINVGAGDKEVLLEISMLNTDDVLEMSLRRLAAYVFQERTGDKTGADRMLAMLPPGTMADVAPDWMVESATAHSKTEAKRAQWVNKPSSSWQGGGGHAKDQAPPWKPGKGRGKGAKGAKH